MSTVIYDMPTYVEGIVVSREGHNRTIYVEWYTGERERLKGQPAESLWNFPDGSKFTIIENRKPSPCGLGEVLFDTFHLIK